MNRGASLDALKNNSQPWDVIVIGGGATGLGAAVEAQSRGYRTLLLEQSDFAKATSSRSTKLIHGGVRYLRQGNLGLVRAALRERGRLLANAPHLCRAVPFVLPVYDWWEGPFYGLGMKLYDRLAGRLRLGNSRQLSRRETLQRLPNLQPSRLRGSVLYEDGQFDDARLALSLAQTLADLGGTPLNYARVTGLRKPGGKVSGVTARDELSAEEYELEARVVINATGVFADAVRHLDEPGAAALIAPSQGIHLVLGPEFLPGESALIVPKTADGRVLFAIPWHGRVVVGTTDTEIEDTPLEPRPREDEVEFVLEHAAQYLERRPGRADVKSVFAGIRPLVAAGKDRRAAALSRDHLLSVSPSNLVTITGGKWTTYRQMGEDAIDAAARVAGLTTRLSVTADLHLHGWTEASSDDRDPLSLYGSDAASVRLTLAEKPDWSQKLHPGLPYLRGEVAWAAREEMAQTVEDVLSRRTRCLPLDARAAIECAPDVASILASELGQDEAWQRRQVEAFTALAKGYLLDGDGV